MNRASRQAYLVLSLSLALIPAPARAQWPEDGVRVTTAPGSRRHPAMVTDGQGGVFIAWQDTDALWRVFLQRIGPDGQPAAGWPAGGIPIGQGCLDGTPGICSDDAGGVYVGLCVSGSPSVYHLVRVAGDGTVAPGWPATGQPLPFVFPSYSATPLRDGAGGAFVNWFYQFTYIDGDGLTRTRTELRLHHILPSGLTVTGWPANGKVIASADALGNVSLVPDGYGGLSLGYDAIFGGGRGTFYFAFLSQVDANGNETYTRSLDCSPGLDGFGISLHHDLGETIASFSERTPRIGEFVQRALVKLNEAGEYVTGWAPFCQPFMPGTALSGPRIVGDGGAGVFLAWRDTRTSPEPDIFALRLDAAGLPVAGWPSSGAPVCVAPGDQMDGPLISDGVGGAFLAWIDTRAGTDIFAYDIYAQRIGPNGIDIAGWPATGFPVCTAPSVQWKVQLVSDGVGGAFVCWEDYRSGSGADIYAYRLGPGGPVPVLLSVASTDVESDRVRIAWQLGEPLAGIVNVLKRTTDGEWTAEGPVLPDGTGRIEYEDRAVRPGGQYGYRLEIIQSGKTEYVGEVWVDIPSAAFGLEGVSPNPSARGWIVSLTLLDDSGAALDLIDVQGRVVATEQLGPLGAGPHEVAVGGSGSLPAGVYMLRLRHAGRTATARGAIVR